jgi:glycosyltransferase involved in cell wall biosynthesis
MPKFVLIEPAIEGWTGHYYEYAARVLRAAKAAGYEPILVVNRAFRNTHSKDIRYIPIYRLGQRLVPKSFPLYYLARKLKNKSQSWIAARKATPVSNVSMPVQSPQIQKDKPLRWVMKRTFGRYKVASFIRDTRALLKQISLSADDIVFFPTASEYELQGLIQIFKYYPDYMNAKWHFLFHSNIIPIELRDAFMRMQHLLAGENLYFYTDTEQLTQQYNQLDILPFTTLPIPIDLGLSQTDKKLKPVTPPFCVSYIGDARGEKGYQHLPDVVKNLWNDYVLKDKIKFVIQSNFNIEEGEPAAIVARAKLDALQGRSVTLLKEPLNPVDYRDLLLKSDIVLFPYDSVAYAARSSGIFTEAMVAGIPVVVPEGSWMALQLQQAIQHYEAAGLLSLDATDAGMPRSVVGMIYKNPEAISECVSEIVSHYAHYRASAKLFSEAWSAYHNPVTLLACLTQ